MASKVEQVANLLMAELRAGRTIPQNNRAAIAALPAEIRQDLTEIAYLKASLLARRTVLKEKLHELAIAKGFTNVVKAMFLDASITVAADRIIIKVS